MSNRAQATLEFTVIFVIMVVLLFSLLALWKNWCDQIIDRQRAYSQNRVISGTYDMGTGPQIPIFLDSDVQEAFPDENTGDGLP